MTTISAAGVTGAAPAAGRPFDLHYYRDILRGALACGYRFRPFGAAAPGRSIYLRHDIDVSLDNAVALARVEAEEGVQATYLPLLHAPTYNLMAPASRRAIAAILAQGHHLGLHYDPVLNGDTAATLADNVGRELDWVEHVLGVRPRVVSFHRPTQVPFEYCTELRGVEVTYAPRYFREIFYYSDSRYRWPGPCPLELFAAGAHERIQLLLHPVWWNDAGYTIEALMARVHAAMGVHVEDYFRHEIVPRYFRQQEGTS